jgi:hypothetical protein
MHHFFMFLVTTCSGSVKEDIINPPESAGQNDVEIVFALHNA